MHSVFNMICVNAGCSKIRGASLEVEKGAVASSSELPISRASPDLPGATADVLHGTDHSIADWPDGLLEQPRSKVDISGTRLVCNIWLCCRSPQSTAPV